METKFESSVRLIEAPQQRVYNLLSNLQNIERIQHRLPEDKAKGIRFDADSVSIDAAPVGQVTLRIIEREEPKTIKFETAESPVPFNFWIQLLPVEADKCKMKLTIKASLNPFIKAMVQRPLQEGIEKIADVLQALEYGSGEDE